MAERLIFQAGGVPAPQGSKRIGRNRATGRAILIDDNAKTKPWRTIVRLAAVAAVARAGASAPWAKRYAPVDLDVVLYLPRPKSVSIKARPLPVTKPDSDKLLRAAYDALSGVVYFDDAQVTDAHVSKRYADSVEPGIVVRATLIDPTTAV